MNFCQLLVVIAVRPFIFDVQVVQELSAGPYMHNTAVIILDNLKLRVTSGCKKKYSLFFAPFCVFLLLGPSWAIGRGGRGGTFQVCVGPVLTQHKRGWGGTFHRLCWGRVNTSNRWCVVVRVVVLCCVVLCCVVLFSFCVMVCYVVLCCVMLCCVVSFLVLFWVFFLCHFVQCFSFLFCCVVLCCILL